ncbi:glycosyltransferase [Flavihumibacter petaseus]|uniref:Putative glycosyltransferase n=1 Tax=Flavihumibacter petaseus NBRC 106054 TaxID=1220578 RepID=A0A0E9N1H9_9BACT|nr:glycosyltransferase [Flavihumibacter petaseus]GAO43709.1 putative glycosyltransferase [Flavihumibacter petaseus NBRC 106054]
MKIAAVVILYNPDESFVKNITSYASVMQEVLVIDNSEKPDREISRKLAALTGITVMQDSNNHGIAHRLNQAADWAISKGFDWLLTMDQDSYFSPDNISRYLQCLTTIASPQSTAMVGVNYLSQEKGQPCMADTVEQLITSGSMVNLATFPKTDRFDEALFIDEVDLDFCYNAISHGFTILQFQNIHLEHELGKNHQFRSLKTFKTTTRNLHAPVRLYYMVRNFLYVNRKYPGQFTADKSRRKQALLNRIKNNLLYGKNRLAVATALFTGYSDFRRGQMGKKK